MNGCFLSRREFMGRSLAAAAGGVLLSGSRGVAEPAARPVVRVGSCSLGLDPARQAGLDGIEIDVGPAADRLRIAEEQVRRGYKDKMKELGLPVRSLITLLLNDYPLASDPRAPAWLEQAIDAARDLGAPVILVAFFCKGDLLDKDNKPREQDIEAAVKRLKAAAPRAKDAGITLAIENYLTGAENARILDRIGSDAVKVYYDVFNTGVTKGHDVPGDIRLLKNRIAQFHFKNGPAYLEDRKDFFERAAAAIREIDYRGWIILETSSPSKDPVADARRNAAFVRQLLG